MRKPRISLTRLASHAIWMTCRCMKASNITSCDRQRRTRRIVITFGSDYQVASSNREHVAPLINHEVGQRGILIGSLKRNSTDDASPRVRPRGYRARNLAHVRRLLWEREIDVNGDDDKKKSRAKTNLANIREREGRRQWPRGRAISSNFFFLLPPRSEKRVPSTLIRGFTGYGCFYPCKRVEYMDIHSLYKI